MSANHRRNRRVPLDIYLNKYLGGVPFLVRASDISEDGIYVSQLIEPEFEGRRVGLQFVLPGTTEVIYAEGELRREGAKGRAQGHGIFFTLLTARHRQMIIDYIDGRLARAA